MDELLLSTDYVLHGPTGQVLHRVTENGAGVAVDYVWLDDPPLAQFETAFDAQGVEQGTPKVTYLHADHLGTPRIGTNQAQQITWRWEATEAFGQSLPAGTDIVRLRFPGQVDLQVGMISYNYFRSYDALLGRYVESDPIGLDGGLNSYGYVNQNPLRGIDPGGTGPVLGSLCTTAATVVTIKDLRDLRKMWDEADDIQRNIDRLESSCAVERQPDWYRQYIVSLRQQKLRLVSDFIVEKKYDLAIDFAFQVGCAAAWAFGP